MIINRHLPSWRKKLQLSLAGLGGKKKKKAAFLTMTVQNPSTVQTIHFTQLTLLFRKLLSKIETGY